MLTADIDSARFPVVASVAADLAEREKARVAPPVLRVWDGNWNLRSIVAGEIEGRAVRRSNATGEIEFTIPKGHYLWDWFMSRRDATSAQNTFLTVDKDGARISGCVDKITFSKDKDGRETCTVHALDDMEMLKSIRIWSNPVLPAAIQFPRVFMLAGPSVWCLKTTIFLNLMRLQSSLFNLPNDPLNFGAWVDNLFMENWPVTIKGGAWHLDPSPHAIISSRFKTAFDLAEPVCEDAGLEILYERWLPGDPEPWPGYTPRAGQLIFDIKDKSQRWGTQGTGGNILTGLVHTALDLAGDFIEMDRTVVSDPNPPRDITEAGTKPGVPWVVYREGLYSGVGESEYTWSPATHTRLTVGGHSMSGVNEAISMAVQLAGDLASTTFIGPNVNLGQIADTVLAPLYTDTILAWMSAPLPQRALKLGWSYYFEYMPGDNDRAYQLSSVLALRRALVATEEKISHSVKVDNGAPYFIGDNGRGDFWVGDRIATEPPGTPGGKLLIDKCSEAEFSWDKDGAGWDIKIGDLEEPNNGWDRIIGKISGLAEALHDQGVL